MIAINTQHQQDAPSRPGNKKIQQDKINSARERTRKETNKKLQDKRHGHYSQTK